MRTANKNNAKHNHAACLDDCIQNVIWTKENSSERDIKFCADKGKREEVDSICRRFSKLTKGDSVRFGRNTFEDTFKNSDFPKDLWWDVLERQDDRILLISSHVIDCRPYNKAIPNPYEMPFSDDFFEEENYDEDVFNGWVKESKEVVPITWETSDLRAWLNREFLAKAFNEWERLTILPTTIRTKGENDTFDYVFCITLEDTKNYFWGRTTLCRCKPTEHAIQKGVSWSDDDMFTYEPEVVLDDHTKSASWWLRDAGLLTSHAAYVSAVGGANPCGISIDDIHVGVRPALWVKIEEG